LIRERRSDDGNSLFEGFRLILDDETKGSEVMNKIVREHYPVSKLPEDLRSEFNGTDTVRVTIQAEAELVGLAAVEAAERKYQEYLQELAVREAVDIGAYRGNVTIEEAVARVRALRDE
jgi:hypothetical protein